jgi:protein-L-isoaspartate(D-aspartate) O-methyltransferase
LCRSDWQSQDLCVRSLDERAVPFRLGMVKALRSMGVTDGVVLDAMASVPRHRYVDRFWAAPTKMPWTPAHVREFVVDDDAADETLRVVYEPSTALATRGPVDVPQATSSLSAPIIVALMLAELHLRPGLRVLEIGTGSGYHAVLMATLVGDPALVTTLDIDQSVISDTVPRLRRLGFDAMTVRCTDGASGAPDRAPFDRVVATVGCADISPAWTAQLAPGGEMLLPLEHGQLHPRVRIHRAPEPIGRFVGQSGFIPIRGVQGTARLWQGSAPLTETGTVEDLPDVLLEALPPGDPSESRLAPAMWDFGTYLAIRDRRATGAGLIEHDSGVMIREGRLVVAGAHGASLRARMLEIAADWSALGSPGLHRYAMRFMPLSVRVDDPPTDSPMGPWHIVRLNHRQTIWITPP